jgi:hypothetical protein
MESNSFIGKLHAHLFASEKEIPKLFNAKEQEMILRYRAAFTKWLAEPHLRDTQMINYLVNEFSIKRSQAYTDLNNVKSLIGNVTMAGKEFQRYRANEMILQGFELAEKAKNSLDIKKAMTLIKAGEALSKVHKLESNDPEPSRWEDIVPMELEPSTDVSVIGRKPIENLDILKHKLRVKYGTEMN